MEDVMMRRRKQKAGRLIKPLDLDQINRKQGFGNNNNNNNGKGMMTREDDKGELLSPGSVVFHTPDFSIHILAIMGCKTSINLEIVKAKLPLTLLKHPRFSSIVALADMMEKDAEVKWGNSIGYVLLPFKIGLRDDPLDYIREAKATVDRKKHSLEALFTFFIAELVMKLLGTKVASALSHRINSHTTMCFSNLVGPLEEIGFYGHPMAFLAPSSYGLPQALMINFQSYVNKMTMVLSVDEGTIPDPKQLCDDIAESLQLVKEAVLKQGLVKGATACPPAS